MIVTRSFSLITRGGSTPSIQPRAVRQHQRWGRRHRPDETGWSSGPVQSPAEPTQHRPAEISAIQSLRATVMAMLCLDFIGGYSRSTGTAAHAVADERAGRRQPFGVGRPGGHVFGGRHGMGVNVAGLRPGDPGEIRLALGQRLDGDQIAHGAVVARAGRHAGPGYRPCGRRRSRSRRGGPSTAGGPNDRRGFALRRFAGPLPCRPLRRAR